MIFLYRYYGYGYGYGLDWTYILVIIGMILTLICSSGVKSTFRRYSKRLAKCGYTGAEVAQMILRENGIYDVTVQHISGELSDNYNNSAKMISLSDDVYGKSTIAAIGVAAHECGHAIQYSEEYAPIKIRNSMVPVANFGSKLGLPIILIGFFISFVDFLIPIGIIMYAAGVAFQFVTLPVEFDASRRALATLEEMHILDSGEEINGARKVLKSAAMTYVAAAAAAVLSLLRLILLFGGKRSRD